MPQRSTAVRRAVYELTMQSATVPSATAVATAASLSRHEVVESFRRLAAGRVLVLQRDSDEILMANPFSAVPTPFLVDAAGQTYFANCIWDGLGIPAMLRCDALIRTSCGDCGAAMQVEVRNERPRGEGLLHFAIPARQWWNDIVFN